MQIHSIRFGFASNSSSTHSIIVLNERHRKHPPEDNDVETQAFQWSHFTAASESAKRAYLGQMLRQQLRKALQGVPGSVVNRLAESWCGVQLNEDGGVDHQSELLIPGEYPGTFPSEGFFGDLMRALLDPAVVVLGGNDNDSESHPLRGMGKGVLRGLPSYGVWTSRRERSGVWVLFNKKDGTRLRLTLSGDASTPTRSDTPELVDLKITDKCDRKCAYCYMNSSAGGKHADAHTVRMLLHQLSYMKVFEVALGGGEPLEHPDLLSFLETCEYLGIVPNITTRRFGFDLDPKLAATLVQRCGCIASSVSSADEVLRVHAYIEANGWLGSTIHNNLKSARLNETHDGKFSVQHAVGTQDERNVLGIIRAAAVTHLPIVLLGYKACGRAKNREPIEVDLIKVLDRCRDEDVYANIGADSVLVRQYGSKLERFSHRLLWTDATEGAFSMYIDAVAETCAPSSYSECVTALPNPATANELVERFDVFASQCGQHSAGCETRGERSNDGRGLSNGRR